MRKILLTGMLLLALIIWNPLSSVEASLVDTEKRIIVKYHSDTSKSIISQYAEAIIEEYEHLPMMAIKISDERLQALKNEGHIEFYEENQSFTIQHQFQVANLSSSELERWNITAMNVHNSWIIGIGETV